MQYSDLIEKKQHGTPAFPVEYYYIDKNHPRYVMSLHWHKEFEIVRVTSGTLTIYLNNMPYEMGAGDCLFIEGGCLKRGYPHNCVYECLVFDISMLHGIADGGSLGSKCKDIKYKNFIHREDVLIHSTIDKLLIATKEAQTFYELETLGLFYKLFYLLYTSDYITKIHHSVTNKRVHTVISLLEWIDHHISESITLTEISDVTGLSQKYSCRIFKEYTAKTIVEYVNERRIEMACSKMLQSSITQAAFDCGFNDLSYFCKIFRKYKGVSAREYKKRNAIRPSPGGS